MNDSEAIKAWAWTWARALSADISRTEEWFDAVKAQTPAEVSDEERAASEGAYSRATTAYFEYLRGNWTRERAERELAELFEALCAEAAAGSHEDEKGAAG